MKKLEKKLLKLDKEVITSLTENDLSGVKGGVLETVGANTCWTCPQPMTQNKLQCEAASIGECPKTKGFCPIPDTQICQQKSVDTPCPPIYERITDRCTNP